MNVAIDGDVSATEVANNVWFLKISHRRNWRFQRGGGSKSREIPGMGGCSKSISIFSRLVKSAKHKAKKKATCKIFDGPKNIKKGLLVLSAFHCLKIFGSRPRSA